MLGELFAATGDRKKGGKNNPWTPYTHAYTTLVVFQKNYFQINTGSLICGDLDYTQQFDLVVYLDFKTKPSIATNVLWNEKPIVHLHRGKWIIEFKMLILCTLTYYHTLLTFSVIVCI